MSLGVVDMMSQRGTPEERSPGGCMYRSRSWRGSLSWVGGFWPSGPSTPALWLWFLGSMSLPSVDCGRAAKMRTDQGAGCSPRGRLRRSVHGQHGSQQLVEVGLVELLAWVCP